MDHTSVDVKKLAYSLRGQFETLNFLSEDCCIYRVPSKFRILNKTPYTPTVVSIGPLHHGREELKPMQEHKLRYLQQFLKHTSVSIEDFLTFIGGKETALRNCYAETINIASEEFIQMILLDAVFLLEIFFRYIPEFHNVDRIFRKPGMIKDIVFDMLLVENQLPMFILQDLFMLARHDLPNTFKNYSLCQFINIFFQYYVCRDIWMRETTLIESNFPEAKHFVDLFRLCLRPQNRKDTERCLVDSEAAPNVTRLNQFGIEFKVASTKNLLDIQFLSEKKILEIPKLTISNMTVHLLRNLRMFEELHCDTNYVNDYGVFLNRLLRTPKDVELLTEMGVIENRILDSKGVSTLFQELSRDARVDIENFYYSSLVKDLRGYCESRRHKWMANMKLNYFSISLIGVVIIFILLEFIKTVCSVIRVL
ncbi:hypothetical protein Q3G72_027145 [Acer saccharum]|nr:hypothetical protein Q3G72_027145 [Acer saccharum]